ncbi:MAG: KR domain-containing protein, partial [bacterium]|nr:KR domain-containing protein [bacterium]
KKELDDWFYAPVWKQTHHPLAAVRQEKTQEKQAQNKAAWMVYCDESGMGDRFAEQLQRQGQEVVRVRIGKEYRRTGNREYEIEPLRPEHYDALLKETGVPQRVVQFWGITPQEAENVFYSLIYQVQAIGKKEIHAPIKMLVITSGNQRVTGEEELHPAAALQQGPVKVIPREYPGISSRSIDVLHPATEEQKQKLNTRILKEIEIEDNYTEIAYRGKYRWALEYQPVKIPPLKNAEPGQTPPVPALLKEKGVYVITGGLGGIGLVLAGYLAKKLRARLVLTGRNVPPPREEWEHNRENSEHQQHADAKIKKLLQLEKEGAELTIEQAEVANKEQMEAVFKRTQKKYGTIDG